MATAADKTEARGRSESEEGLAKIWAEVLRQPHTEPNANFFDIGGDSLKAMEVVMRVSEVFKVDLPLIAFFEDPTLGHLAAVIDELKATGTTTPIIRVPGRREFPLSSSQQVFWLLEQQNPGTGIYNTARIFRIRGTVNAAVLERSLNELQRRHEILQVRFIEGVNGPVQVVKPVEPLQLAVADVCGLEAGASEQAGLKLALETVSAPFNLSNGPVWRALWVRLAAEDSLLALAMHHVVSDGFTGSILLNELGAIYDAFAAGRPSPLPEPELHFTDYAAWEQEWMDGSRIEGELEYWRSALEGAAPSIDLPADFVHPSRSDRRGRQRSVTIPGESLRKVQALAQLNGTTLFTALAAGLRILLFRWSGQTDFLLGTMASNRSRSGTEGMVGCFVNPLPLRNPVTGGETALDVLDRERNAVLDAFAHQDCSFAKIVEAVNPERSDSDNPLFNVALLLQNFPAIALGGRSFEAEHVTFDSQMALLDLRFIATETPHGLRLDCEYRLDLFDDQTIQSLLENYVSVLAQMATAPDTLLEHISISEDLPRRGRDDRTIAIASTFTAGPLQEPLAFWMEKFRIPSRIEFAPFNQVFQELLDATSLLARNTGGFNVVLVRLEDWLQQAGEGENTAREFTASLKRAALRSETPYLVCILAPLTRPAAHEEIFARMEARLISELSDTAGVHLISSEQVLDLYPVANPEDAYALKLGSIPYTPAFYTALATMLARRIYNLRATPAKVIALACNQTFAPPLALQEFLIAQFDAGMILCLCGKNGEEDDPGRVFEGDREMRLTRDYFSAVRVSRKPQSESLREFARDLQLGLDNFIFVAADQVECAEVRAACAEVTVIELPAGVEKIADFLRHCWAFDHWSAMAEDRGPTALSRDSSLLTRIASELGSVEAIVYQIESRKSSRLAKRDGHISPRSGTEEILAAIWAGRLPVSDPGVHDNFFDLGGNSLLAAQVIARVRQTLGVEVPLRTLFDAPTIAEFTVRVDSARRAQTGLTVPPLIPAARSGHPPVSFAQQRLWFIEQLEPGKCLYNIPQMFRLWGNLNADALERSLNEIVSRHESLRTTFETVDGQPVQVIVPSLHLPLPITDLSLLNEENRAAEVRRIGQEEALRPFDLATGPVLRTSLLRLAPEEHVLLLTFHHIASDGWSLGVLANELEILYGALAGNQTATLPKLAVQYADFAIWQRDWLRDEVLEKQAAYWRQQLAGAPAVLEFPSDRPRAARPAHRGALLSRLLPKELVEKLTALSHAEGATLFMTLLAAFQTLLFRYSGQEDIVVGSPIAGRNYAEIEPLIGFFVNTLALRTDLSGNPSFRELVRRAKEVTLNAYLHQDIPFEKLVQELQSERSLSYNPIFQVVFALQNAPMQALALPGLRLERIPMHPGTALFDLSWFAIPVPDGLLIRAEYSSDLFDEPTVGRALENFEQLLAGAVANPELALSELPVLAFEEQHRLLVEWNDTAAPYPAENCAHEMFERQSARTPENVAVVFGAEQLTYGELNYRANQIAGYLRRQGVGPNVCVGVALPRSPGMITALLGIMKAGGAYLPLDVEYPKERLAYIIDDAQIPVVLTEKQWLDQLPKHIPTLCLDRDLAEIESQPGENPPLQTQAGDLAYVIYTSGSTGQPKGVEIQHRGLVNLIVWHQRQYQVLADDHATLVASPAFDASVWEIWPYLTAGASLHIPNQETRSSPQELLNWLAREAISLTFLPTPLAEAVLGVLETHAAPGLKLRALLTGGDKLHAGVKPGLPFAVFNHYGPTESTVVTTWTRVMEYADAPPPIGKPIANTRAYVLDRHMKPVPIGAPGELYIGGDGLARGYRNRPELTAERFVRDAFSASGSARLFRSGDRVRYLPNGDLEFLGRIDDQIKLRGYRIELGEIESVLGQHGAVKECVVDAREKVPGEKQLVAYVVSRDGSDLPVAEFRALLHRQLPEYMVPAVFVSVEGFRLTPNGKVDRKALPVPEDSAGKPACVAPRSPVEELVAAMWTEVLKRRGIGVHDNFFELGGHSLLATRIVSRIRDSTGVDLPLRLIFESPTIAELASRIEGAGRSSLLPRLQRVAARDKGLALSFAQERLWFLDQFEPNHPYYNSPFAIRMNGVLRFDALELALNEIVRRHEVLRTTFRVEAYQPVQVIAPALRIEIPLADLSGLSAGEQEAAAGRMALEAAQRTFNLETGPVFRATLLRLAGQHHILLLNFHHIAIDGWSLWQFMQELTVLYEAFGEGRPSPLPELPVQYADYAVWHRDWMKDEVLAKLLAYWKKQLAGAPAMLELPADRTRPPVLSYNGATAKIGCSPRLADELNALSRRENVTLFMTMLAAFQTLLFRYSGQEDIVVGSSIANRTQLGAEDLIGFFVNALAMRTDLSGNPTFRELLRRVRTMALEAYAHQDLPFEKLVEALQPDRVLGQTPLFQVCFVLQNAPRSSFHLPELELSAMNVHNGTTKFDLSLFVVEKPEGLSCIAEYSTDLFDASSIERLLGHYRVLLESIVDHPDERIAALPLLTAEEEHVLLAEWNDTSPQLPPQTCVHEHFELQADRTPENIAVVFEDRRLTYSELNQRANQLAHRLQALGVGPEILVGICLERSVEMLVCILGVLKAGGGYLPLDPAYPQDRLAFMLEDAQVQVLLTQAALMTSLPAHHAMAICMDSDWTSIASEPVRNPSRRARSNNVAYVIYTSGSTGKPKGCQIQHGSLINYLDWAAEYYFEDSGEGNFPLFSSLSFDLTVTSLFLPLLRGRTISVFPQDLETGQILKEIFAGGTEIDCVKLTPSHVSLLEHLNLGHSSVRVAIVGGEALSLHHVQLLQNLNPEMRIFNEYGPTETTVGCVVSRVTPEKQPVLIGRPIRNTSIYILDDARNLVPAGVIGEMYVGGHGVARGYLNRPELTAERFLADPFRCSPAARLYKTGDLARFLPDGTLQYLGRIDQQVKIRGFRIELEEIEAALDHHSGVRQSVVIVREDQPGDKRLVAYLVFDPDYFGSDRAEPEEALAMEQVTRWTEAFDESYRRGGDAAEATFNITGWDSSYSGEPIDAVDMRAWVETTVARIRSLGIQRVWEIGCGTGLLLFRLAPHSDRYYGTDISQTALGFVQDQLSRPDLNLPHLQLERRAAHEFEKERHAGQFTTVVLNSVIQYFPDLDYLMRVMDGAVEAVAPGGAVFIGDLRSLPLLEAFHTSVQLYKAPDSMTCSQLRQRAQASMRQEGELLIDPEFFLALRRRHPAIGHVEIQLKRGHAHNELTLFRYDVILHIGDPSLPLKDCVWRDWKKEGLTLPTLREVLQRTNPEILALTNVPNARLSTDCAALRMLSSDEGYSTVGELRARLPDAAGPAVEPEDLWSIEHEFPYRVEIRSSGAAPEGCCDVLLRRTDADGAIRHWATPRFPGETDANRPWRTYANSPLRQREAAKLIPQVRSWLDRKLPDYMCPSAYVVLDSLPLTTNGKVNRRTLPAPDEIRPEGQSEYVMPSGPVEELVASVFADVLRIDRAGAGDDFFELGGHSLSATQVVSRIRRAFQIELPVRALFESPTVGGLSKVVEQIQRGARGLVPPPIVPVSRNRPLPLSIAQQRLWILDQVEPNNPLYNVPRAIRLIGTLNVDALGKALNGIVERHEVLRTAYCAELDEPVQVIAPELRMDLPRVDLSSLAAVDREKESRRILQEECGKAFDLAKESILRCLLLKLGEQEHILFLNTHHIANDGWSNGVFMRDLAALYSAALEGKPALLPELAIQYADYAVWQRNWLQGEILARQLEYWKARLRGAPPILALPTDRPRPAKQTFSGARHIAVLPAGLMQAVRALSRQHETTTFMTLFAAFCSLILYYSKQTDIVLGTDVAGRNDVRTEALIGFFVNLLVLRTDLSGDPTVAELLARVRETALGAYTHQDAPFDKLVEELRPERSLSHTPFVQILFVQMNKTHGEVQMPGLEMSAVPMDVPSKFDLAVFASESAQHSSVMWVYNSDLFDATTIERMAFLYQTALETMTAHAHMNLIELMRLLTDTDQQQRATENQQFQQISLQKLKTIRRKAATKI